ncbi:hypothetical protein RN001_012756 [Aquatica leii]|uniref:G-protein coupled receptors family 3 profile domain-containing protein n=1 Tax=Aquatica leii TaxID=1421715 RepID=A0AAN7PT67_9COLE|nr:hypothetical protein RN001_012756 [Aquatica leii]
MKLVSQILLLSNVLLVSVAINNQSLCGVNQMYDLNGDLNIALIVNECSSVNSVSWTYVNSALWITNRLNTINFTSPLSLGLSVFQTCTEDDNYDAIYKIFKERDQRYFLNTYLKQPLDTKLVRFSNALKVRLSTITARNNWAMDCAIKLLLTLGFRDNITVYAENEHNLEEFYSLARINQICIKNGFVFEVKSIDAFNPRNDVLVLFGKSKIIKEFLETVTSDVQMIFVPSDPSIHIDVPEGSYIIEPLLSESTLSLKFTPSPLFFDIANAFLKNIVTTLDFFFDNCNETSPKIDCLKSNTNEYVDGVVTLSSQKTIDVLNLKNFTGLFNYNVFRVENLSSEVQSFVNVYTYNVFNSSLTGLGLNASNIETNVLCPRCRLSCVNFIPKLPPKTILISYAFSKFGLRTESWVIGFLAVSLLGVVFCLAVFIFIIVRFCKKDILEGNPFLTMILLVTVILMYCSVVPFALDSDKEMRNYICIARALSSSLIYALAFSLLLSRSILLATISKEVGFMAHVPGPVQSFLTLFIFGVQGALSLQFTYHCEDTFRGISFVYLMSYNVILLILLLFICPLNTRSQRNYREGRYFTIAIVLIACIWSCWIPSYAVFNNEWKDPMVCFGLVSTASILLGAVFIPRTYMMTVAATRDRLTSAIPSLQANSSIVDVYRASAQPIYDCINIAAINARCAPPLPPPLPQNEVYSSPTMPYEEQYDFERSITPNADKVTRF